MDHWIGESPLCQRYNRLCRLDLQPQCLVRDRFVGGVWSFQWRREVTGRSSDLLARLMDDLNQIMRLEGEDTFCWNIGSTGLFTVGATRNHIDDLMLPTMDLQTRWYKILPRKVNILFWRLRLDRLPHRLNLSRRGLDITSIMCPVCSNEVESNKHLFFYCAVASNIWRLVRIWCDMSILILNSHSDWIEHLQISNALKERMIVIVATKLSHEDLEWSFRRKPRGGVEQRAGTFLCEFSVSSIRKVIDAVFLPCGSVKTIQTRWYKIIPRKVNIFFWRLRLDRLPHRLNLSRRGLDITSIMCPVCSNGVESNKHLFFYCAVASNIWRLVRIWCDMSIPILNSHSDWLDWIENLRISNALKERMIVIVVTTCWCLWNYRNPVTFFSQNLRKCGIYDSIRLFSFSWLNSRSSNRLA
ncbi:RNA-directed DNA polymerase, eukaryota, reverse transcriptase zinc-binding domain protein [Tanacetum coccineum]